MVEPDAFSPEPAFAYDLPRPIFLNVGRIAVEKNLPAFLSLDLPGSGRWWHRDRVLPVRAGERLLTHVG